MAYAANTSVSVSKTKGEIDALLRKHKATSVGTLEEQRVGKTNSGRLLDRKEHNAFPVVT